MSEPNLTDEELRLLRTLLPALQEEVEYREDKKLIWHTNKQIIIGLAAIVSAVVMLKDTAIAAIKNLVQ